MIAAIRKTPVEGTGVAPSPRVKMLRSIGTCTGVPMQDLAEGDVLILSTGAYVVMNTQYSVRRNGRRITLRELESSRLHSIPYLPDARVSRLKLPAQVAEGEGLWTIQAGDIVLYPHSSPECSVAAVRHHYGWLRTSAPWSPFSDAEILLHVQEGQARVIRSSLRGGAQPLPHYPIGSVAACRSAKTPEPTVWVRTGDDYWVSNTRGVTASDLMINYELDRRTYHVVWVPGVH